MKMQYSFTNQWLLVVGVAGSLILGSGELPTYGQSQHPLAASARLNAVQQIQALMADKAHWTKAQQKLDSQLIFHARFKATGMVHPAAPQLRPSLTPEADGRIKVDINATVTPDLEAAVQTAGGTILASLPGYHLAPPTRPGVFIGRNLPRD